jgi:fructose-bisphosphate aldolase class I
MASIDLPATARALVVDGKGILAADETVGTMTRRLEVWEVESTAESRQTYREMFFSTPGIAECISGVIMQDETIHQRTSRGVPLAQLLTRQGILPGIKVDNGTKPLIGSPAEKVTEGLDGLGRRLEDYRNLGARFAKWRGVIAVSETLPSAACINENAYALARYAALCQERDLVPIVEPEVLMSGGHTLERCEEVTGKVLHAVFAQLFQEKVLLEGMLLKPNMVTAGELCAQQASVEQVAQATLRCLRRHVPCAVPGIVFLSGGQSPQLATEHLTAINLADGAKPWKLTFSYGRALQQEALEIWHGDSAQFQAGQRAFHHRATCDRAAALGKYTPAMEAQRVVV